MTAAAARALDAGDAASAGDHETIDVVSHGPAILLSRAHPRIRDDDDDGDDDDDDGDDLDETTDEYGTTDEEYAYRRGRHAVPMHSPGENLSDIDLMADQHLDARSMPRLPRLRNRVFFQSDDGSTTSAGGRVRSRRVLFRRRKREEGDVFWTAVFVSNLLSLAVLSCLVVYLTQTDFFASHQNELFGTTVDNRFTVVSQQDARAKIYLKSGYSNSRYSEAMIAFGDGILQLGRRALASTDAQRFYGLALSHNGTAAFTNQVTAPSVVTEYVHARKALVFEDGSVMTSAANLSGGVKETGDLNLVSTSGSVVTSAGGKPVLIVDALGKVVVPSASAEDPTTMGVVVDGAAGRISISDAFSVAHAANASTISTTAPALRLNATRVVLGTSSADRVTLTVARPPLSSRDDDTDDDNDDATADSGDEPDATRNGTSTRALTATVKATTLAITGQSSSSQSQGGDVWIAGGDGLDRGGDVVIAGGVTLDLDNVRVGTVAINAQLDHASASVTEIGTQSGSHSVSIHGNVQFNRNATAAAGDNATQVAIGGAAFRVTAQRIALDNADADASSLQLDSHAIRIGTDAAEPIAIGSAARSTVAIHATSAVLDATESVAIGESARSVRIGGHGAETRGRRSIDLVADAIRFATARASDGANQTLADVEIANNSILVHAHRLSVGASGHTASIALRARAVSIGNASESASVRVAGKSFAVSSDTVELGGEDSQTTVNGDSIVLDASDAIRVGEDADHIALGSNGTEDVTVGAKAIRLDGAIRITGAAVLVDSNEVALGGKATRKVTLGDAATKTTAVVGAAVEIGAAATSIAIGAKSPAVSIGSTNSVINLQGKVMLNGAALDSRHRALRAEAHWFSYLSAAHVAVDVAPSAVRSEFALPVTDHFVSSDTAAAVVVSETSPTALVVSADVESGHARLALALDSTTEECHARLAIQLECCKCLSVAVFSHDRNRIILVADGVVEIVLAARQQFPLDVKLLEATSVLLTNLSHNCESNRKRILEAGGVDSVLQAMQAFPQHASVQKKSCWSLLTLADFMCHEIAARGGLGAVLAGMLNCPSDEHVQFYGAWALVNLVSGTSRLQHFARREGVAEVAEAALACFPDHPGIQEKAHEVLQLLSHTRTSA